MKCSLLWSCPEISREELQALIESGKGYILIDVRERSEIAQHGAIPTSKNIPLSEFQHALELEQHEFKAKYGFVWHHDDRAILYCRSGDRSARACAYARSRGYNASNYAGSVLDWSRIDSDVHAY